MARLIVLDSGPLQLLCLRPGVAVADRCRAWFNDLISAGEAVLLPGIADYEVRRELIRKGASAMIGNLDALRTGLRFLPIDQDALDRAAEFWADARRRGRPTAAPDALDGDAILAAQAELAAGPGDTVVVATTNTGHLSRYVDAQPWESIAP